MRTSRYLVFLLPICFATGAWAQAALPATEVEAVVTTDLGTFRFEFAPDKGAQARGAVHGARAPGLL